MHDLFTHPCNPLHHAVTFIRRRDIARAVISDTADDLKSAFAMVGRDIAPILEIEREISSLHRRLKTTVDAFVEHGRRSSFDTKTMAIMYKQHELFSLIMRLWRGQDPGYLEWIDRNRLESMFGLEVVG